jgi:hypothetical protein
LVTPTLTRFMAWDPSPSLQAFADIWRARTPAMAAGTDLAPAASQIDWRVSGHGRAAADRLRAARDRHLDQGIGARHGLWPRSCGRNHGLGNRTPSAAFIYPVAVGNEPSRRLAESLSGAPVGRRVQHEPSGATLDEVNLSDTGNVKPYGRFSGRGQPCLASAMISGRYSK